MTLKYYRQIIRYVYVVNKNVSENKVYIINNNCLIYIPVTMSMQWNIIILTLFAIKKGAAFCVLIEIFDKPYVIQQIMELFASA